MVDIQSGAERVFRLDLASGELKERRRTQQGGLIADANLTRTGVFEYRMPDGSRRRELRHPDEVFHPDSLATYDGATATIDHPGRVSPDNWKRVTIGHVGGSRVRADGDFVRGEVHIQDAGAIGRAESGDLRELSCGYTCDIDPTPGTYKGQPYDVAQKNIRINHVAVGPAGWGRMGPETRLRLDSREAVSGEPNETKAPALYVRDAMNESEFRVALEDAKLKAENATRELEVARADATNAKSEADRATAKSREDSALIGKLQAENAMLKLQQERDRAQDKRAEERVRADADVQRLVEELVQLRADAAAVFASPTDPDGQAYRPEGKSSDEIRRDVIRHLEPKMTFDSIDKIQDEVARSMALRSVYDIAIGHKRAVDQARADALAAAGAQRRADGGDGDEDEEQYDVGKARKDMMSKRRDAWKGRGDRRGRGDRGSLRVVEK